MFLLNEHSYFFINYKNKVIFRKLWWFNFDKNLFSVRAQMGDPKFQNRLLFYVCVLFNSKKI